MSLEKIEADICAITTTTPIERVAEVYSAMSFVRERAKELQGILEQQLFEWIEVNGPIHIGETILFVGTVRKPPKCQNLPATVEAILQACGGDFDQFCQHLSANAIKPGACKQTLSAEKYAELFKVEEREELQCEEAAKAERKLQKADQRFIKH